MKIGIITLWQSSDNYGQQLQCWALQQYLKALGHAPFLIRYKIQKQTPFLLLSYLKRIIKVVLSFIVKRYKEDMMGDRLRHENEKKNAQRRFREFRDANIVQSMAEYNSLKELRRNPPEADVYITGSDQVWAFMLPREESKALFLDFGDSKVKRIAYAPSFARDNYPEDLKNILCEQLKRFNAISAREKSGVGICSNVGFQAEKVVDPTLLLSKDFYDKIMDKKKMRHKYIYLYYLNISNEEEIKWEELAILSKSKQLEVIATPASGYIPGREIISGIQYAYATIGEWLSFINQSEFVVTTSFHGVVFCLIYHKRFIYFPLMGKFSKGNNRVLDLLSDLALTTLIWKSNSTYKDMLNIEIIWDVVDMKMKQMRESSERFLNANI